MVGIRAFERRDLRWLSAWLDEPGVRTWWRESSDAVEVERRYGPCIDGTDPTELYMVLDSGAPAGMVQLYLYEDEPEWSQVIEGCGIDVKGAAGIDYLLTSTSQGRGIGTQMVRQVLDRARAPGVTKMVVGVSSANVASWKMLEKVGFTCAYEGPINSSDPSDAGDQKLMVLTL